MYFFPYLLPLLGYPPLRLLYYKTPRRERAFCLILQALSPSVLTPRNPQLRFMIPKVFYPFTLCFR